MEKPARPEVSTNPDDYEDVDIDDPDNPEWTEEDFARARPFKEVFPDLYEAMTRDAPDEPAPVRKAS